jgi:hypothetical protein
MLLPFSGWKIKPSVEKAVQLQGDGGRKYLRNVGKLYQTTRRHIPENSYLHYLDSLYPAVYTELRQGNPPMK